MTVRESDGEPSGSHPRVVVTKLQCEEWTRVYCREGKGQGPFLGKTIQEEAERPERWHGACGAPRSQCGYSTEGRRGTPASRCWKTGEGARCGAPIPPSSTVSVLLLLKSCVSDTQPSVRMLLPGIGGRIRELPCKVLWEVLSPHRRVLCQLPTSP